MIKPLNIFLTYNNYLIFIDLHDNYLFFIDMHDNYLLLICIIITHLQQYIITFFFFTTK